MELTDAQEEERYLRISEAARLVFMSVDTLRRYADNGKLPSTRTPGNQRRFKLSDVEALKRGELAA